MSVTRTPVFEALIVPYRSLTSKGILIVAGGLSLAILASALRFWLWGAWPVVAFSLIEVPLLIVLLVVNQQRARANELIMLDATHLTVIRSDPAGRRKREELPAAWLRVDLEVSRGMSRLVLSSRGRTCEVGAFLHEPDRQALFDALAAAIHDARNPRFDNPQLR